MTNWYSAASDHRNHAFQDKERDQRRTDTIDALVEQVDYLSSKLMTLECQLHKVDELQGKVDELERLVMRATASEGW